MLSGIYRKRLWDNQVQFWNNLGLSNLKVILMQLDRIYLMTFLLFAKVDAEPSFDPGRSLLITIMTGIVMG